MRVNYKEYETDRNKFRIHFNGDIYRLSKGKRGNLTVPKGEWYKLNPIYNKAGYAQVHIDDKCSFIHRLVGEMFLLDWDESKQIDHIDGDKSNNNIENLRMVTNQENQMSYQSKTKGTSKYRGVFFASREQKWISRIKKNKKSLYCWNF